jgi:hypothetical protein
MLQNTYRMLVIFLAIRQNSLLEQNRGYLHLLLQQPMQCKQNSMFLYVYPEILSSDRTFRSIQLCYSIFFNL